MKKVTVIIPIYNVEKYLKQCIESITTQTLKDIEIICVNDGSTDGSRDIALQFMEHDERIVLIDKENGGLSSARNAGLKKAIGKYIYFLDSDDFLEQNALEELYSVAEKDNLDVVYFSAEPFFESEAAKENNLNYVTYYTRKGTYKGVMQGKDFYIQSEKNREFKPNVCIQLYKHDFLEQISASFYEGILHEDNLFTLKTMIQAGSVRFINYGYYHRRLRNSSIMTSTKSIKNVYGYFITIVEAEKFIDSMNLPKDVMEMLNERILIWQSMAVEIYDNLQDKEITGIIEENSKEHIIFNSIIKTPDRLILKERSAKYKMQAQLKKEKEDLQTKLQEEHKKLENTSYELDCIKNSVSFKIGRIFTYIPRKLKNSSLRVRK